MQNIDILEQHIAELSIDLLKTLLKDRTTGDYIRWATDNYESYGKEYFANGIIKPDLVMGDFTKIVQPRVMKSKEKREKRTRDKAEVFTPSWVCNEQNNLLDEAWFGRKNVFNISGKNCWNTIKDKIKFSKEKDWMLYVNDKRLEVSCGEAPYLVSRYDTVTGDAIPVEDRIGLLDRKLRVINENVDEEEEWYKWTLRAFQSVYGYEYQGDNILLARENLLCTFMDNMTYKFDHEATVKQLNEIARITSWNIWQMDGITMTVPYSEHEINKAQMTIFDFIDVEENIQLEKQAIPAKIFDWRSNCSLEFRSMVQ
ncbi:MAG: restriction endonuclease subunit M [Eubacterium sp.]|nr:restriction endonuclease subunit M [Eubacterium sp.]